MRILKPVEFKSRLSGRGYVVKSLIDTGAEISIVPHELARRINARITKKFINIIGVHGQSMNLPLGEIGVFFPFLGNKGGYFLVAVSPVEKQPIIGMDIMRLLGIVIDTKTGEVSVKNEIWEAFKTIAGLGTLYFLSVKLLESILEEK